VITSQGNVGSTFNYNNVTLDFNNELHTGDFFSIYDFQGVGSVTRTGLLLTDFVLTTPVLTPGVTNLGIVAQDNIFLPNILLTYVGPGISGISTSGLNLGNLTVVTSMSTFGVVTDKYVGAYTTEGA